MDNGPTGSLKYSPHYSDEKRSTTTLQALEPLLRSKEGIEVARKVLFHYMSKEKQKDELIRDKQRSGGVLQTDTAA